MQIGELRAKNFKRVEEVVIHAAGRRVVLIGGRNGQGKSSVLDSILAALGGAKAVPSEPVRRGSENGSVEIDLGEIKVVRTFRGDGKTSLKVTAKDGGKYGQARLDAIFSRLGPDPVAFLNAKPAEQIEIAKEALGLDLSEFDRRRAEAFEARTDVNRDAKRLEGELAGLTIHEDAPAVEESAAAIIAEIREAGEHNTRGHRLQSAARDAQDRAAHFRRQAEEIEDQIAKLQEARVAIYAQRDAAVKDLAEAEKVADEFVGIDTAHLQARLDAIEETNRKARENKKRAEVAAALEQKRKESERLTRMLASIDSERAAAIKAAKFPVEGLEIGQDGLLLDGLPFGQASSAQRLRIAVAMGITMNPELRVFLVRDGSLLDDESLALFCEMAEEHDAQFWIERVGDRDEEAIIIEAGAVKDRATA